MPYDFPIIKVSDHSIKGVHTFWGRSSHRSWNPLMGLKQIEPPYLYGYGVRIRGRILLGVCRERQEDKPLVEPIGPWTPSED